MKLSILAALNTSTSIKISSNTNIINTHNLNHMVNMVNHINHSC